MDNNTDTSLNPSERKRARHLRLIDGGKTDKAIQASPGGLTPAKRGKGALNEHGLTSLQESFAQLASTGISLTEAYRRSGYAFAGMTSESLWNSAYKLSQGPKVKARIARLTSESQGNSLHDARKAKAYLIERLKAEAEREGSRASDRLKALELIGKLEHVGAFRERSEIVDTRADKLEDIEARLEALLKATG